VTPSRGTSVRIEWAPLGGGDCRWPFDDLAPCFPHGYPSFRDRFCGLVHGFAVFNPHATIRLDYFGQQTTWKATDRKWDKWKPCKPTSPHWYEQRHLERLIGAYVSHDRDVQKDRLVSDFIAEFDGLTGSAKRTKVLTDTGLKRANLSELVVGDRFDAERITKLLASMRRHTRPVKPCRLGIIGEAHFKARLLEMGVKPASFRYCRKLSEGKSKKLQGGAPDEKASFSEVPWVLESAFGWLGEEAEDSRRIFAGANWSAAIKNPFRSFGSTGEGLETALADRRATSAEPVVFVLHLAHPRVEYTDRGKSAIVIGGAA
jgi:hypothetical protein